MRTKALQKKMQKDVSRFFVAQAVPEIYEKNEMLKNRGEVFFCYSLYIFLAQARLGFGLLSFGKYSCSAAHLRYNKLGCRKFEIAKA